MRRIDLFEATMQGWSRLNPSTDGAVFQAGLKAALRLDRPRVSGLAPAAGQDRSARPLEMDPSALCDFRHDMVALLKQLPVRPDDADRGRM